MSSGSSQGFCAHVNPTQNKIWPIAMRIYPSQSSWMVEWSAFSTHQSCTQPTYATYLFSELKAELQRSGKRVVQENTEGRGPSVNPRLVAVLTLRLFSSKQNILLCTNTGGLALAGINLRKCEGFLTTRNPAKLPFLVRVPPTKRPKTPASAQDYLCQLIDQLFLSSGREEFGHLLR